MLEEIVYILTNEAMPGYIKIGFTNDLTRRMKELDRSGAIPLPFECFYAARVSDMKKTERLMHRAFNEQRTRSNREFFEVPPEQAQAALTMAALEDVTPNEQDTVDDVLDLTAVQTARRKNFNFEMIGVKPGEVLQHAIDPNVTCEVIDTRRVRFEGEITSLSSSALTILHRLGYSTPTAAGTAYWLYKGKRLWELRDEVEGS